MQSGVRSFGSSVSGARCWDGAVARVATSCPHTCVRERGECGQMGHEKHVPAGTESSQAGSGQPRTELADASRPDPRADGAPHGRPSASRRPQWGTVPGRRVWESEDDLRRCSAGGTCISTPCVSVGDRGAPGRAARRKRGPRRATWFIRTGSGWSWRARRRAKCAGSLGGIVSSPRFPHECGDVR